MFHRARRAWAWSRVQHYSARGDLEAATRWLQRVEDGELDPLRKLIIEAFKAAILMRQHRFDEADRLFDTLANKTDPPRGENERYINLFVRSLRAGTHGNEVLEQHLLREAGGVKCRPSLRRWLPIAEPGLP